MVHDRSHVEICPWCAADLREAGASRCEPASTVAVIELGEITAYFSRTDAQTTWDSRRAVRNIAELAGLANSGQLARAIGTSKVTTWGWWNGATRISLPLALHAFSQLRVSFSSAVIGGKDARAVRLSEETQSVFYLRTRQPPRLIDWERVQRRLTAFAKAPLSTAPSFLAVATELSIERRTLRVHFPKICRTIARRPREKLALDRRRRDRTLHFEFKHAIRQLVLKALPVNPVDLERHLKRPGLFNSRYARTALRKAFVSFAKAAASAKPAERPRWR